MARQATGDLCLRLSNRVTIKTEWRSSTECFFFLLVSTRSLARELSALFERGGIILTNA